jgi:hypothetical protein
VNHHVRRAIAALAADDHARSGWLRRAGGGLSVPPESYVHGFGWIRANASWLSGWTDHGAHFGLRPGLVDRWRIRRAVRAWAKRRRMETNP